MQNKPLFIIAEAGVNHNGDMALARRLIDVAVEAGADAVKFQSFVVDELVTPSAAMAAYQQRNLAKVQSQRAMLEKLALSFEQQIRLAEYALERGILWLSSPFDLKSLDFLITTMRLPMLKIPSGELTNGPLLLRSAQSGLPLILSTGMTTLADIDRALSVVAWGMLNGDEPPCPAALASIRRSPQAQALLEARVTLLHCTSEYPAPPESINLRAMQTLQTHFSLPVGFSDHSQGIHVPLAAVALGASVLEKHFTLSRGLPGPDHAASLEPHELSELIAQARDVQRAMGDGIKQPTQAEQETAVCAKRRLVALRAIAAGERFTSENMGVRRHDSGRSAMEYWELLGQVAKRTYAAGEGL